MEAQVSLRCRYSPGPFPRCQLSTALGRSLFEWYCGFEDLFCILAAYESLLPPQWRYRNIKIRALFAEIEYKQFPENEPERRIPRMLDDVWGYMYAFGPPLRKIITGTIELKQMPKGEEKRLRARELERQLRDVDIKVTRFMNSKLSLEVLQTIPFQPEYYLDQHTNCCPYFPFESLLFRFPPAGVFLIASLCLQTYLRTVLHPSIWTEIDPSEERIPLAGQTAEQMSIDLCRAFAGLESTLSEFPEIIIPCQAPMMVAGLACPSDLRLWVFCKLLHLDRVGQPLSDAIRRNLAEQWNMPELETLDSHAFIPRATLEKGDVSGLAEGLEKVELTGEGPSGDVMEDRNVTQHRGIFLMGKERERENVEVGRQGERVDSASGEDKRRPVFSL